MRRRSFFIAFEIEKNDWAILNFFHFYSLLYCVKEKK